MALGVCICDVCSVLMLSQGDLDVKESEDANWLDGRRLKEGRSSQRDKMKLPAKHEWSH